MWKVELDAFLSSKLQSMAEQRQEEKAASLTQSEREIYLLWTLEALGGNPGIFAPDARVICRLHKPTSSGK